MSCYCQHQWLWAFSVAVDFRQFCLIASVAVGCFLQWFQRMAVDCRQVLFKWPRWLWTLGSLLLLASVAVDLGVPSVTALGGCGPWGPFCYWPQWLWTLGSLLVFASVAVDLGVTFITGLSGCGPWGPFRYWPQWLWVKLFSSLSGCGTVTSVGDLTLLGPSAAQWLWTSGSISSSSVDV